MNENPIVPEFQEFPKMGRLNREIIISEKIDGTNAQIFIGDAGEFYVGSRSKWITPESDNYGFARWATNHKEELLQLGPGRHFGEWWGSGIQRTYGLKGGDKRFSLFNTIRWCLADQEPQVIPQANPTAQEKRQERLPACCGLVPILYRGPFDTAFVASTLTTLGVTGSKAVPEFMDPEGIVVFHIAANCGFKVTLKDDGIPKSLVKKNETVVAS